MSGIIANLPLQYQQNPEIKNRRLCENRKLSCETGFF